MNPGCNSGTTLMQTKEPIATFTIGVLIHENVQQSPLRCLPATFCEYFASCYCIVSYSIIQFIMHGFLLFAGMTHQSLQFVWGNSALLWRNCAAPPLKTCKIGVRSRYRSGNDRKCNLHLSVKSQSHQVPNFKRQENNGEATSNG